MTQRKRFTTGLVAIGLTIGVQVATANPSEPAFRIMSDDEIATHSEAMRSLQGSARDDYRNAQYDLLRQRALEQGYAMPATPPWGNATSPVPSPETETLAPAAIAEAEARHAEMREKMQAHREAVQPSASLQETTTTEPATVPLQETLPETVAQQAEEQTAPAETQVKTTVEVDNTEQTISDVQPDTQTADAVPAPDTPAGTELPPPPSADSASVAVIEVDTELSPTAGADEAAPVETANTESEPSPDTATGYASSEAMNNYRETMRARFDEYMRERQAQIDENARRQREQHEAALEQNRAARPQIPAPYRPYPPMPPAYGPTYPGAFPGYGVPYWQPPR